MPIIELSQALIPNLQVIGSAARTEWCDSVVQGLYVLVSRSGSRSFFWRTKLQGKTKHFPIGHASDITLAAARNLVLQWKSGIEPPLHKTTGAPTEKNSEMTLTAFWQSYYLPHAKQRKRSWKRDEQLWRIRIEPKFGHQRLRDIQRLDIQMFHGSLVQEAGLSQATADLHAALLKRMLSLCVEWSILDKNPAAKMQLFHPDNRVEHFLDEAQLARLVEVLRTDTCRNVASVCLFLLATGCRLNEALSARWQQIDREKCTFKVVASNSKSKRMRLVPLNDIAMEVLDCLDTEGKHEHLFVNSRTGKRFVNITRVWYKLRNKAGIPHVRIHDLRHSAASNLINSGASLYIVQQVLGHSNPSVTQRYAHVSMQTLHDASANAAAIVNRARLSSTKPDLVLV